MRPTVKVTRVMEPTKLSKLISGDVGRAITIARPRRRRGWRAWARALLVIKRRHFRSTCQLALLPHSAQISRSYRPTSCAPCHWIYTAHTLKWQILLSCLLQNATQPSIQADFVFFSFEQNAFYSRVHLYHATDLSLHTRIGVSPSIWPNTVTRLADFDPKVVYLSMSNFH